MKTILRIALTLLFCVTIFFFVSTTAFADNIDSGTWGDLTWTLDENYVLTISGNGDMNDFEWDIGWVSNDAWRKYTSYTTSVNIENGVTSIGQLAFYGYSNLTSITIPESVTGIGDYSFGDCISLTSVTIPSRMASIGKNSFSNCSSLTSITFPEGVKIGNQAFSGCNSLASVIIPSGVQIDDSSSSPFSHCDCLKTAGPIGSGCNIEFGWTDTIPKCAFWGCESLVNITFPNSLTSIGEWAFGYCRGLKSVMIPSNVTSIGYRAFHECSGLTSITIPSSVTYIGIYAFYGCNGLETAGPIGSGCDYEFGWTTAIPDSAFQSCNNLARVSIPESVTSIGNNAFVSCSSLTNIVLPSGITSIGYGAFSACRNLGTIFLPLGVTSIGAGAFADCSNMTEVHFMGSPPSIHDKAFTNVTADAYYPANKGWTSEQMQDYSGNLTWKVDTVIDSGTCGAQGANLTWTLYENGELVIAGTGEMADYTEIQSPWTSFLIYSVKLEKGVSNIGKSAFRGCKSLSFVTIPDSVVNIGTYALRGCNGLTSITIPSSVTSIEYQAFTDCENLTAINVDSDNPSYCDLNGVLYNKEMTTLWSFPSGRNGDYRIPDGVTQIFTGAFSFCPNLTYVTIPSSVTSFGDGGAFVSCSSLPSITIPEGVESIGTNTFYFCGNLKSVVIPSSVTNIGDGAFYGCYSLRDIYYLGTHAQWDHILLGSKNNFLTSAKIHYISAPDLILPSDLITLEEEAFMGGAFVYPKLSENTVSIGRRAFADCQNLAYIYIPEATTDIDANAFGDLSTLTIFGKTGSTAEAFAQTHGFDFVAVT